MRRRKVRQSPRPMTRPPIPGPISAGLCRADSAASVARSARRDDLLAGAGLPNRRSGCLPTRKPHRGRRGTAIRHVRPNPRPRARPGAVLRRRHCFRRRVVALVAGTRARAFSDRRIPSGSGSSTSRSTRRTTSRRTIPARTARPRPRRSSSSRGLPCWAHACGRPVAIGRLLVAVKSRRCRRRGQSSYRGCRWSSSRLGRWRLSDVIGPDASPMMTSRPARLPGPSSPHHRPPRPAQIPTPPGPPDRRCRGSSAPDRDRPSMDPEGLVALPGARRPASWRARPRGSRRRPGSPGIGAAPSRRRNPDDSP